MRVEKSWPSRAGAPCARARWMAAWVGTACAWFAVGAAAQSATPAAPASIPVTQRLTVCGACHSADGRSTLADVPSLAAQPKVFLETQLVLIREGLRDVPQMKGMLDGVTDADLIAMAAHYAALPLAAQPGLRRTDAFERGKALSDRALCNSCHLPTYLGQQQVPRLAGQREDYLLYSMRQFRDGKAVGRDSIMASSLYGITDVQLLDLAHFLSQLK